MCHNCRLQKAGIAFKREKQQLRRAPRKAAEKMKPNGSPSYALGNPCGILLASVVLGHPIQQLPEDIHGIAAVNVTDRQLPTEQQVSGPSSTAAESSSSHG